VALLPALNQEFTANAEAFLATVDDMMAKLDELSTQLDEVAASADRIGVGSEGSDALSASIDRLSVAVEGLEERLGGLDGTLDSVTASIDENTVAVDENSAAMDEHAASTDAAGESAVGFGSKAKLAVLGVSAALVYSVVKAAEYQSQMTTLLTQAGVAKSQFKGLETGVLSLAGSVGQSPDSLAQALYHIESSFQSVGITGSKALSLLKIASEGAATGHADLVDVTNALDATIVAGIPGIHNYSQAMGALNAIVGSGDMTMQDLATAMGTGVMAQAKLYGQSIEQVGAALATFGDNNIRGAKAATDLRMTWQAIQAPLVAGVPVLNKLGLGASTLAETMTHHGLTAALQQFTDHLVASKVPMDQWGMLITEIFGKRAGSGIGIMLDQLDRLKGKLPDIQRGADGFGNAWKTQTKTVAQQFADFKANLDSVAISFGQVLLPDVDKAMDGLNKFFHVVEQHPVLAKLAGAFVAVAVAMGIMTAAGAALDAVMTANPIMLVVLAVIALTAGLYELYEHSKLVRDVVADVANFFKSAFQAAMHAAGAVVQWFVTGPLAFIKAQLAVFSQFWQQQHAEIERIAKVVWDLIGGEIKAAWSLISAYLEASLDVLVGLFKFAWSVIYNVVKAAWDIIATVVSSSIREVLDIVDIVLDLLQGHWGAAWHALENLVSTVLHETTSVIHDILSAFVGIMVALGKDLIMGLIHGIESMIGGAVKAVEDVAHGVINAAKSVLSIFSPSQVFIDIGKQVGRGLVIGLEGTASQVNSAASTLASDVKEAFQAGYIGQGEADSLTNMIAGDNIRLQNLANQRATILKTITTAENYATSTASSVVSNASLSNVVSAMPSGSVITSYGLAAGLQTDLTQINQFSAAVKKLGQLGLNKNLLNQIIQAGPASGLPVAQALLNGPISEIQTLNKTENQISSAATSLGDTAANAMYDSGADAGKGFLSGLEGQVSSIDKVMAKIADTMVSRIRDDLGIHSPSTVFQAHGLAVAQGLAAGMDEGTPLVEAASHRLSAAVGIALGGGGAGVGGSTTVNNHYEITVPVTTQTGFIDSQAAATIARAVQTALLQIEKRNPLPQTTLPH